MPELCRDEVTIYYCDDGPQRRSEAETGAESAREQVVLLIHGHTLDRTVWDDMVDPLTAAGLRALRPDLRGHGQSSRPGGGYHWSHHAADMTAVLEHAGVCRPDGQEPGQLVLRPGVGLTVVGFSVGGGVALEMAITMPGLLSKLVLVAPVMPDRPFEPAFMDSIRQVARTARADGIEAAMSGPWMDSPLLAVSLQRPGVRVRVEQMVRAFPGAEYLATERDRVERSWRLPDRLGEISAPTRVVVGEREMQGFSAFAQEAASSIAGARLDKIPGAGHLIPLEAGEMLSEILIDHAG